MKKNKLFLFIVLSLFMLLLSSGHAQGLEVSSYPKIPMLPTITDKSSLGDYVSYWVGALIYVAGALSLISFAIGAIGLINPNIEAHNDAKDRMKGAVLGLLLTMASVVILQTINIKFVKLTISPLEGVEGIYYTDGKNQKPCPQEEADVSNVPEGFNKIEYSCSENADKNKMPALLIWMFPKTGFQGSDGKYKDVKVERITCGGKAPINGTSFRMEFESPGVYYCLDGCSGGNMCSGFMSGPNTSSQNNIIEPFRENIKGVRIVNDLDNKLDYGAIFHQAPGLENGGICSEKPIMTAEREKEKCQSIGDIKASAVDIFKISSDYAAAGDGVIFYSEPFGEGSGAKAGFYSVKDSDIDQLTKLNPQDMVYQWDGVFQPQEYRDTFKTFGDSTSGSKTNGSIKINGDYLVALYSGGSYCQTFTSTVTNLNVQPFKQPGGSLSSIYIIPIKR